MFQITYQIAIQNYHWITWMKAGLVYIADISSVRFTETIEPGDKTAVCFT